MSIIKSNSALVVFEDTKLNPESKFNVLNFLQSISINTSTKRLNQKYIGDKKINQTQFVKPEIELSFSYLHRIDFLNEILFGFEVNLGQLVNKSFAHNLINNFSNSGAFILLSNLQDEDLVFQIVNNNYNTNMIAMSFGNLFLNSYSFSYKIGSPPLVNCSFLTSEFSASNLINDSGFKYKTWDNQYKLLDTDFLNFYLSQTNGSVGDNIVLQMKDFSIENDLSQSLKIGPTINSLLDGVVQSIDVSLNLNRNTYYFFEGANSPSSRKIILPITCDLKIEGISKSFALDNLSKLFTEDNYFNFTLLLGKDVNGLYDFYKMYFSKVKVNNFSYSIDLNGFLKYTLDCVTLVDDQEGLNIIAINNKTNFTNYIYSSDNYIIYDNNGVSLAVR